MMLQSREFFEDILSFSPLQQGRFKSSQLVYGAQKCNYALAKLQSLLLRS